MCDGLGLLCRIQGRWLRGSLNQISYHGILQHRFCTWLVRASSYSRIMIQNISPSSARTTSGKKNEMMSLKTWSVQHILQTPSSWFGMNWTEEVQSIPEMNWSTGPAKQFTSATHLWELQQQIWEELSEEYLISNLSCYICQRRVLCWVKRLEYISVCKLIPCFYF